MKRRTFIKGLLVGLILPFIPFKKSESDILKDVQAMREAVKEPSVYIGDPVYLGKDRMLTTIKPTENGRAVVNIGKVVKVENEDKDSYGVRTIHVYIDQIGEVVA